VAFQREGSIITWRPTDHITAWFSTRLGGTSLPPFDTMNLSFGVGDVSVSVKENRRRMLALMGRPLDDLVMPHQVHGGTVTWISAADRGRGRVPDVPPIPATDGFLTDVADVVLGMGFADCVPIFLADVKGRFFGLLHAGWRGTAAKIQQTGVQQLMQRGVLPEDIRVGLGPRIGPCCYEVDQPVYDRIRAVAGSTPLTPVDDRHWRLDLHLANRLMLEAVGILPEHIDEAPYCTACHPELFFSYRRDHHVTGRMGGYICRT